MMDFARLTGPDAAFKPAKVLDVGCGIGGTSRYLAKASRQAGRRDVTNEGEGEGGGRVVLRLLIFSYYNRSWAPARRWRASRCPRSRSSGACERMTWACSYLPRAIRPRRTHVHHRWPTDTPTDRPTDRSTTTQREGAGGGAERAQRGLQGHGRPPDELPGACTHIRPVSSPTRGDCACAHRGLNQALLDGLNE